MSARKKLSATLSKVHRCAVCSQVRRVTARVYVCEDGISHHVWINQYNAGLFQRKHDFANLLVY